MYSRHEHDGAGRTESLQLIVVLRPSSDGGVVGPLPRGIILGFHLLQLLLDVVGVELIFAGELWVAAHSSSVAVEVESVFVLNDNSLIAQVFAAVLGDGGLFLVPIWASGVDVEPVEVQVPAGCPRILGGVVNVCEVHIPGEGCCIASFWIDRVRSFEKGRRGLLWQ